MENFPNLAWFCGNSIPKALGPLGGFWASIPAPSSFQGFGFQSRPCVHSQLCSCSSSQELGLNPSSRGEDWLWEFSCRERGWPWPRCCSVPQSHFPGPNSIWDGLGGAGFCFAHSRGVSAAPEEDFVVVPMEFRILRALQECLQELQDNVSSTEPHSQRGVGSQSPSRQLWEFFWDARHGKAVELFCLQDSQDRSTLGNLEFAAGRFLGWRITWELRDAGRWSCRLLFPGKSRECWHGRDVPEFPEDPGGSSPFLKTPKSQRWNS